MPRYLRTSLAEYFPSPIEERLLIAIHVFSSSFSKTQATLRQFVGSFVGSHVSPLSPTFFADPFPSRPHWNPLLPCLFVLIRLISSPFSFPFNCFSPFVFFLDFNSYFFFTSFLSFPLLRVFPRVPPLLSPRRIPHFLPPPRLFRFSTSSTSASPSSTSSLYFLPPPLPHRERRDGQNLTRGKPIIICRSVEEPGGPRACHFNSLYPHKLITSCIPRRLSNSILIGEYSMVSKSVPTAPASPRLAALPDANKTPNTPLFVFQTQRDEEKTKKNTRKTDYWGRA